MCIVTLLYSCGWRIPLVFPTFHKVVIHYRYITFTPLRKSLPPGPLDTKKNPFARFAACSGKIRNAHACLINILSFSLPSVLDAHGRLWKHLRCQPRYSR